MYRVLIVDDEPFIREGFKMLIDWEKEGFFMPIVAKNAFEAIEIVQNDKYDLIFIDIRMPKMNGIELAKYIREKISNLIHIVFLTGYLDIEYVNQAFSLGAVQYLQKPVQPIQLVEVLKNIRMRLEQKKNEDKFIRKSHRDLREYYILELIQGVKNVENIKYMQSVFRNEHVIHYLNFNFYKADQNAKELTQPEMESIKNKFKERFKDKEYYVITHVGGVREFVIGLIITGEYLNEKRISIYEYVDLVLARLDKDTDYKAVVRIGKKVDDISKLGESYRDAMNEIPYKLNSNEIPLEVRIKSYIDAHYMDNITLKSISEQFYVNTAYLGQFFKKHHGVFLKDYLNSVRVKKSQELLLKTSLKIYQVAKSVGFQSADSFISAFSKETGYTPQRYRLMRENKND